MNNGRDEIDSLRNAELQFNQCIEKLMQEHKEDSGRVVGEKDQLTSELVG